MKKLFLLLTLILAGLVQGYSQNTRITGTVTNSDDGTTLPGVTVMLKGTTVGAITDLDGKYSLDVPAGAQTLVFSFIGMKSVELPIAGKTIIDLVMEKDVKEIAEVVVTGLGVPTDRRKVGMSVETVKAEDLSKLPTASVDQALIGKVPGALISSVSGQPGQQQNIILRGINVLGTSNPMILVDGVQINTDNVYNGSLSNFSSRLADLDFGDIERVEVVQGSAAATIYGAQGANGVIQIFTKKGKAGRSSVSYNTSMSYNNVLRGNFKFPTKHFYETDAEGYILDEGGNRMALGTDGYYPAPAGEGNANAIGVRMDKPYMETTYDQMDQVFKPNALTTNNSLSINGGNEKITYAAFVSRLNQESTLHGDYVRNNVRLNLGFELAKNLRFDISSTYINSNNNTGSITGQDNVESPLGSALLSRRYINMKSRDPNGFLIGRLEDDNSVNPLFAYENSLYSADVNRIIENVGVNYKPFKFFEVDYKYGIDYYNYKYQRLIKNQEAFLSPGIDPFNGQMEARFYKGMTVNSLLSGFLRFNTMDDFGTSFKLNSITQVALDYRSNYFNRIINQVTGLPPGEDFNMSQAGSPVIDEYTEELVTYGYLLNEKLEFGELMGISGGFRMDWSSAYGKASEAFVFPRGDFYFRVSQLGFWDGLKVLVPEFKLRAAYGVAGTQPGAYDRYITLKSDGIGDKTYLVSQAIQKNPNLGVQVSREFEIGSDIRIALSSGNWLPYVSLSPTYWRRNAEDVIWDVEVPLSTGSGRLKDNAISMYGEGFQFGVNATLLKNANFSWDFSTNFSKGHTQIDKISNGKDIVLGASGSGGYVLREGYDVGVMFGFKPLTSIQETNSEGDRYIDPADESDYALVNGMVVDTADQTVVFTSEKKVIGNSTPDFNISFINEFKIGQAVSISFQIDWVKGCDVYNQTKQWLFRDLVHYENQVPVTIGTETGAFTRYYTSLYQTNQPNAYFVEDGSFVRLRSVQASVDLAKVFKLKLVKGLNLNLAGYNLFTISDYSGLDPESAANLDDPIQRGLDLYAFPNFRTFTAGLTVNF